MRVSRNPTKVHHSISQIARNVFVKTTPNTITNSYTYQWYGPHQHWSAKPSIDEFAKLYPDQAITISIRPDTVSKEADKIYEALSIGGYRYNPDFQLYEMPTFVEELACKALVTDLRLIAFGLKIANYEAHSWDSEDDQTTEPTLVTLFVFEYAEDAKLFKNFIKKMDLHKVDDESSL
jgi:hypothetical protein